MGATVVYSSMSIPDDRACDGTVAEIRLPNDFLIDISWFRRNKSYHVRLYHEFYESMIGSEYVLASPQSVVEIVRELALCTRMRASIEYLSGNAYIEFDRDSRREGVRAITSAITERSSGFSMVTGQRSKKRKHKSKSNAKHSARGQRANAKYDTIFDRELHFD